MIATVFGDKARFCDAECHENFREDRLGGLNYGPHFFNDVVCQHREEWSLVACCCAYCGKPVSGKIPDRLREKFNFKAK